MTRVFQLDGDRCLTFYRDCVLDNPHVFPCPAVLVLIRVGRIRIIDIQIFRIGSENRQSPRAVIVVTDRHAGKHRLAAADHVPARRDQVHPVAQRRRALRTVRIVHHHRITAPGQPAAHYPVVAADVLCALTELERRRLLRRSSRRERHRTAKRVVQIENRAPDQGEIDRWIRRDVRVAALEVHDVLHLVGAEQAHGLRHLHFLIDIGEQRIVARDHDVRRPRRRLDADQLEFNRQ